MTSALTNQQRVFKACLTQTERDSDDITRKIGPLDFTEKKLGDYEQLLRPFFSCFHGGKNEIKR